MFIRSELGEAKPTEGKSPKANPDILENEESTGPHIAYRKNRLP
jgi:hypothetical protein